MTSIGELSEAEILRRILPSFRMGADVLVPPGDDAAVIRSGPSVVVTTDSMVRGRDWRDDWSSARDVGAKVVAQNVADIAAMGARCTGLLVALVADPATSVDWVTQLAEGLGAAAVDAGVSIVGGDLSSAPEGVLVVAVTAFGDLEGRAPVLRSGARVGDVVAVCGTLGWSGGGLALFVAGASARGPEMLSEVAGVGLSGAAPAVPPPGATSAVPPPGATSAVPPPGATSAVPPPGATSAELSDAAEAPRDGISPSACRTFEMARDGDIGRAQALLMSAHRTAGRPPYESGPLAARAGATSLIDISDGLVRDASRVAAASGVSIELSGSALEREVDGPLRVALGGQEGLRQVLSGGEEHSLLATFGPDAVPVDDSSPWRVIGSVVERSPGRALVMVDGVEPAVRGWDHFAG